MAQGRLRAGARSRSGISSRHQERSQDHGSSDYGDPPRRVGHFGIERHQEGLGPDARRGELPVMCFGLRTYQFRSERSALLRRVCGSVRAPGSPPLGGLPALHDVDPLARHLGVSELEQLDPVLPRTALVADRELDDDQVLTCRGPSTRYRTAAGYWRRHSVKLITPSNRSPDCGNSSTASSW